MVALTKPEVKKIMGDGTEKLEPINPNHLAPEGLHVCHKTKKVGFTQLITHRAYHSIATQTFCFKIPPRCTTYRKGAATKYKKGVEYRDREYFFCCRGYKVANDTNHCVPKCDYDCMEDKGQGYCYTPDVCRCEKGFGGQYCQSECPGDKWGANCTNNCTCGPHGDCDPYDGTCTCHKGYTGINCTLECVNSFGPNCIHSCKCENNATCDIVDGKCTCAEGFYGPKCEIECQEGYYGIGCLTNCECENGGFCFHDPNDSWYKVRCECKTTGYHGNKCSIRDCPPEEYIKDINETTGEPICTKCSQCNWNFTDSCHPKNGSCICSNGYEGDDCTKTCDSPYYGEQCKHECICKNGECHHVTGNCTNCYAGYIGLRCEANCGTNKYGPHCEFDCKCPNTSECNAYTGECHCLAGYIGPNCSETCPSGYHGINCRLKCDCNENSGVCDPLSGHCECKGGWYGLKCEKRCHPLRWGPYCSEGCNCTSNGVCDPDTGSCYCDSGYYGDTCDEETYSIGGFGLRIGQTATQRKVANMVVPGIVLFFCFIFLIIYSSRRGWCKNKFPVILRRKQKETDKIPGNVNPAFGIEEEINEGDEHPSPAPPPVLKRKPSIGNYAGMTDIQIPLSEERPDLEKPFDVDDADDLYGETPVLAAGGSNYHSYIVHDINKPGTNDNNMPGTNDNNMPGANDNNKPGTNDNK
ncbi:hypothetical protein ACF0H5_010350 [Mactra antiquata]